MIPLAPLAYYSLYYQQKQIFSIQYKCHISGSRLVYYMNIVNTRRHIMNTEQITEQLKNIYQTLTFDNLDTLFADDFIAHGSHLPAPMNQAQFIGFLQILTRACSEMDFHPYVSDINGNEFKLSWQLTAKHTGILRLSAIGMPDFEPTQRTFSLPEDVYHMTISDNKISKITINPVNGGGIQGMIQQLGLM